MSHILLKEKITCFEPVFQESIEQFVVQYFSSILEGRKFGLEDLTIDFDSRLSVGLDDHYSVDVFFRCFLGAAFSGFKSNKIIPNHYLFRLM